MSENTITTEALDSNDPVIAIFNKVWEQLLSRLDAPLGESDSLAVRTAIVRAATEGLKDGARLVADVVSEQDDPTVKVELSLDGIPCVDLWARRYGDG